MATIYERRMATACALEAYFNQSLQAMHTFHWPATNVEEFYRVEREEEKRCCSYGKHRHINL